MDVRLLVSLLVCAAAPVFAQHPGAPRSAAGSPVHVAPPQASQFDFLIGEWNVVVRAKVSSLAARIHGAPRIQGTWKARRALDGWGIEDDLKLMDGSGNPTSLTHAVRVYDFTNRRWSQTSLDVYRGRFAQATGEWKDGAMVLTGSGSDAEGRAYITRTRYYDISPAGFKSQQDRSYDDGRTWEEAVLRIEAKR
jgi:hypothetical protein